jgi:hypothetical protein
MSVICVKFGFGHKVLLAMKIGGISSAKISNVDPEVRKSKDLRSETSSDSYRLCLSTLNLLFTTASLEACRWWLGSLSIPVDYAPEGPRRSLMQR